MGMSCGDGAAGVRDVAGWFERLFGGGRAIEVRAPGCGRGGRRVNVVSRFAPGRFEEAAREALRLSGHAAGVYVVLNGVDPGMGTGVDLKGGGAKGGDVPSRRWILVDCDPVRPADVGATDGEKGEAHALAMRVKEGLGREGWPEPVVADSGNGYHLLYAVDLPNDDESAALVKGVLAALAGRYDTDAAKVDRKVYDAPRLVKAYGTRSCKGGETGERPHRDSKVVSVPDEIKCVDVKLLRALAAGAPKGGGFVVPDVKAPGNGVEGRAVAYLAKCEEAVSGRDGHGRAFKAACAVGPGFDLEPEAAFRLLWNHYNPRCVPPWSEKELRHKVADAYKVEGRRGWLRDRKPRGAAAASKGQGGGIDNNLNVDDDGRPTILVSTEEHEVVDQAVRALGDDPTVFQRGFMLVTVRRDAPGPGQVDRPPGSPRLCQLPAARLRERLTKFARWRRWKEGRDGEFRVIPAHPPDWAVAAVGARGEWPGLRRLEAVVEAPVLRPDGSVLDAPGYDPATGLLYEPNAAFETVDPHPTLDDARAAAALLFGLVADFPFAGPAHRAAWLAALLTPLARFAVAGPCPLFLFDAASAGSGKTKLCDLIFALRTGRGASRTDYAEANDEMKKTITAVAIAGDPIVLIDNVAAPFGGSALDGALTGTTWKARILGRSEMTPDLPLSTVWLATGNNVRLKGDVMRRIVPCRLESPVARPEERSDFRHPDLLGHVLANRPRYLRAALTILRAFACAGRPEQGLTPFGSFESWSSAVRAPVFWATGLDPCAPRDDARASDDDAENASHIVSGWAELPHGTDTGVTTAQALRLLKEHPDKLETLRNALMACSRDHELPTPKAVGVRLKALRGKVFEDKRLGACSLQSKPYQGTQLWSVQCAPLRGSGGSGGSVFIASREKYNISDSLSIGKKVKPEGITPTTPTTPTNAPAADSFESRVVEVMETQWVDREEACRRVSLAMFGPPPPPGA